jgi:hypothetical protein
MDKEIHGKLILQMSFYSPPPHPRAAKMSAALELLSSKQYKANNA